MHFTSIALTAACAIGALAAPAPAGHVLHEKRETAPRAWVKRHAVERNVKLPMRIGLTQSNMDNGPELLMEVYVVTSMNRLQSIANVV